MGNDCSDFLMTTLCQAQDMPEEKPSACTNCGKLEYQIALKRGGNRILTPLEIPNFKELSSGSTKNKETIDFLVKNNGMLDADSLKIEVFDGAKLLYSDTSLTPPPKGKNTPWQWDGYDSADVLDTKVLKSKDLHVLLTATKSSEPDPQTWNLDLKNEAEEEEWVDARIDRNAKTVEVTIRAGFKDGGVTGSDPYKLATVATPYSDLERMSKEGIEHYWTRDGSRFDGTNVINAPVKTTKGDFKVTVKVEVNVAPHADKFKIFELCEPEPGTSQRSNTIFDEIYHNLGFYYSEEKRYGNSTLPDPDAAILSAARYAADEIFKKTSAHEFGHFILAAYGGGGFWKGYSSTHKGTSHWVPQNPIEGHHYPPSGEIDLMHYHDIRPSFFDALNRSVAAEEDVKSLLWLGRVGFQERRL
jgi:hypothetical protein